MSAYRHTRTYALIHILVHAELHVPISRTYTYAKTLRHEGTQTDAANLPDLARLAQNALTSLSCTGMLAQPEYGAARPETCINPLRGQLTRPAIAWNHQNASQSSLPGVIGIHSTHNIHTRLPYLFIRLTQGTQTHTHTHHTIVHNHTHIHTYTKHTRYTRSPRSPAHRQRGHGCGHLRGLQLPPGLVGRLLVRRLPGAHTDTRTPHPHSHTHSNTHTAH